MYDDPRILDIPENPPEQRLFVAVILQAITLALRDGDTRWFKDPWAIRIAYYAGFNEDILPKCIAFIEQMRAKGRFHLLGRNHSDKDYAAMLAGIARRGEAVKASYKTIGEEQRRVAAAHGRRGGRLGAQMRGAET